MMVGCGKWCISQVHDWYSLHDSWGSQLVAGSFDWCSCVYIYVHPQALCTFTPALQILYTDHALVYPVNPATYLSKYVYILA